MREVVVALGVVVCASVAAWVHPPAPSETDTGATVVAYLTDDRIGESSGLVIGRAARGGRDPVEFVTTNDSGDTGRLYVIDAATGATVRDVDWSDAPTDVEALAPAGPGAVWVGDIGDNGSVRDAVEVARVSLDDGDSTTYELVYPDGAHDAETLLADPRTQRLYVVTKTLLGGAVYAAPQRLRTDRSNRLRRVEGIEPGVIGRLVTDGAFTADGRSVVLRTYTRATVHRLPDWEIVDDLDLPTQPQGEALALDRSGRIYLSSEGEGQPILRIPAPPGIRGSAPPSPSDSGSEALTDGGASVADGGAAPAASESPSPWLPALIGIGLVGGIAAAYGTIRRARGRIGGMG